MDGYNATIFAYGQTGSGKTYTMKGNLRRPGIIPLAVQDLFEYIKTTPEREFLLRVSYFEIYNEVINDLLDPTNTHLTIRESKSKGVYIENLKEEIVSSPEQCMSLLAAGESHRHISATTFNMVSSRSHTIFRVVIESKARQEGTEPRSELSNTNLNLTSFSSEGIPVRVSCLNLIDLAGSEKASAHTLDPHLRQKEGSYINKSLLTLGNVISRLSSEKRNGHIPYRDSKLTRILEPSLRGNARIAIICTLSVASSSFEESHNTLKFASRAKTIKNSARVNEFMDDKSLIKKYRNEINALKKKLSAVMEAEASLKKLEELQSEKQRV
jgi:centromeric protein E